ncbi:dUTP diphosphatase [Stutzerimonas nitrititolerans]|uniref:dUTP diphosphatase n=1 Tax=Stutzerimonas nitrititolerans TaxID=2482751 RepID=UPI0028A642B0|nr:dUTP diphosphatase [Stutzerimonas nitrititolerans]
MIAIQRMRAHDLPPPIQQTQGSAGYDLANANPLGSTLTIYPGERVLVPTGFAWAIPNGFVGLVRPRSGLANREGLDVMAGVIDSDYRGEVQVLLVNHGDRPVVIGYGGRIAQLVIVAHRNDTLVEADSLTETQRGHFGFGSTGVEVTHE